MASVMIVHFNIQMPQFYWQITVPPTPEAAIDVFLQLSMHRWPAHCLCMTGKAKETS